MHPIQQPVPMVQLYRQPLHGSQPVDAARGSRTIAPCSRVQSLQHKDPGSQGIPKQPRLGQSKKNLGNDSTIVMKSLQVITHVFVDRNYLESGMMIKQHLALTAARWAHLTRHSGSAKPGPRTCKSKYKSNASSAARMHSVCLSGLGESHGWKTHRRIAMQKNNLHTPGKLPSNGK